MRALRRTLTRGIETLTARSEVATVGEIPEDLAELSMVDQIRVAEDLIKPVADIPFGHQEVDLSEQASQRIEEIARVMQECPDLHLLVEGHAGGMKARTEERLLRMTQVRAEMVVHALSRTYGLRNKISARGHGAERGLRYGIVRVVILLPPKEHTPPPSDDEEQREPIVPSAASTVAASRVEARLAATEARDRAAAAAEEARIAVLEATEERQAFHYRQQRIQMEEEKAAMLVAHQQALLALHQSRSPLFVAVEALADSAGFTAADARLAATQASAEASAAVACIAGEHEQAARRKANAVEREMKRWSAAVERERAMLLESCDHRSHQVSRASSGYRISEAEEPEVQKRSTQTSCLSLCCTVEDTTGCEAVDGCDERAPEDDWEEMVRDSRTLSRTSLL